ncbi:unknown [Prevotella sp. CAG:732]|nr:unknown [Prevotella sp. CAG:732]
MDDKSVLLTLLNVLLNLFGLHGEPMDDAITFVSASNSTAFLIPFLSIKSFRYTV